MIDLKHSLYFGLPQQLGGKESACNAGGHSNSLQSSRLGFPVDREPWWGYRHRVAKNRTQLKPLSMHARTCRELHTLLSIKLK